MRAAKVSENADVPSRPRDAFDIYFRIDAIAADRQVGWQFAVGFEWAK